MIQQYHTKKIPNHIFPSFQSYLKYSEFITKHKKIRSLVQTSNALNHNGNTNEYSCIFYIQTKKSVYTNRTLLSLSPYFRFVFSFWLLQDFIMFLFFFSSSTYQISLCVCVCLFSFWFFFVFAKTNWILFFFLAFVRSNESSFSFHF